jgi:chromosome segregation ATPase
MQEERLASVRARLTALEGQIQSNRQEVAQYSAEAASAATAATAKQTSTEADLAANKATLQREQVATVSLSSQLEVARRNLDMTRTSADAAEQEVKPVSGAAQLERGGGGFDEDGLHPRAKNSVQRAPSVV